MNTHASNIRASDGLDPDQFGSDVSEDCGEHRLALAVLEQALEDFTKHHGTIDPIRQRSFRRAHLWLLSDERRWPYSFLNLCELLDISSKTLRSRLRRSTVGEGAEASRTVERNIS